MATISIGGLDKTVVDPKVVFVIALKAKASSIILTYNHPSGNINTSLIDRQVARKLVQCDELLEIQVSDHIIVASDGYDSYADDNLI